MRLLKLVESKESKPIGKRKKVVEKAVETSKKLKKRSK